MLEEISDEVDLYSVIRQINRIAQQNYGSGLRWSYLTLLGDREAHSSWGMLVVAWHRKVCREPILMNSSPVSMPELPRAVS